MVGRSAAMHDAARGELIARKPVCPNAWDHAGAKTLEGLSSPAAWLATNGGQDQAGADRNSEAPPGALSGAKVKRGRGLRERSRSRLLPEDPRRANPKGAASGRCANTASVARDSRKGQSPEAAACRAGPSASAAVATAGETACGSFHAETRGYLAGGGSSEG
jgi:hypothetical protein